MSAQSLRAMTKAELIQVITDANDRNIKLSDELHALRTTLNATIADHKDMAEELALTQRKLAASQAVINELTKPANAPSSARAAYLTKLAANRAVDLARLEAWNAKCAAARKAAMETGKVVLV